MTTPQDSPPDFTPSPLDPADWPAFRAEAHRLLDACIDHLATARAHPWRPLGEADRAALALGDADAGFGTAALADELARKVLPFATGNIHPRFFGWVHGTGLASGLPGLDATDDVARIHAPCPQRQDGGAANVLAAQAVQQHRL